MSLRDRGPGRRIVNARRVAGVDFVGDPYAETRQTQLQPEIASRLQGAGGNVYVGDRGDPTRSFGGYAEAPQRFVSAVPVLASQPARVTYPAGSSATIDTGPVDGPYAVPAARIFAQRMNRRT